MLSLIVAYDKNHLIGKNGNMPWYIKGELSRFRKLTENNIVIMGRKTFESLGKPLPNRINIILSTKENFSVENSLTFGNLNAALDYSRRNHPDKNIYIIGGANLYSQCMDKIDKMYITEIDYEYEGETYFPSFDENDFVKTTDEIHEGNPTYIYTTYTRK